MWVDRGGFPLSLEARGSVGQDNPEARLAHIEYLLEKALHRKGLDIGPGAWLWEFVGVAVVLLLLQLLVLLINSVVVVLLALLVVVVVAVVIVVRCCVAVLFFVVLCVVIGIVQCWCCWG